ncbi:aldehyde dehydrogenase (NADP(+)) [Nocardioides sp. LHG3406-4]|uniref:aldehyde dehydrogenase (NADP(+)) n=1 Tax=Nocardioides sp. LHG3406-4 TaxID=2804575 RepID=UPI003CE897E3
MTAQTDHATHQQVELTGAQLIGTDDVRGREGELHAVDPSTGKTLEPSYGMGSTEDVARAAILADKAFAAYRATDPETRARFLETIADNIEAIGDQLIERVQAETGIPAARVTGERARTTGQLRLFAKVLREGEWLGARVEEALPDRSPMPRPDLRQRQVPLGPVAVFGASNFPLAFSVAGGDTASALAAGAPVVVKAHEAHPGTSELVGRAIRDAVATCGLPEGTFSMVYGAGPVVGTALVTDPRIKAVGFTGSRGAGLAIARAAAARPEPIPVYAEMSSVNPVFVLPAALAGRAEELGAAYIASVTTGVGQLCTSPGLVFVLDGEGADDFVAAAARAVQASTTAPMLGERIQQSFEEGVQRVVRRPGVNLVAAGAPDAGLAFPGCARLMETTATAFLDDETLREEVFGAASILVRARDLAQLQSVIASMEGQLTATIHADEADLELAGELVPLLELKVGRIVMNGWPTGVEVGDAMVHGGPFPATSDARTTSVGTRAIERFLRPVAYQGFPPALLPPGIDVANAWSVPRRLNGQAARG